jgi:hypothetical protein
MAIKELELKIKTLEEMVKSQAIEIRTLKDIEEINRLQRAYGYYLEHWMAQEVIDLFSDSPEISLHLAVGTFLGRTGIKRYFEHNKPDNEFLHQMMQLSGIVDVEPDGNTAKGRWYGFGAIAHPPRNLNTRCKKLTMINRWSAFSSYFCLMDSSTGSPPVSPIMSRITRSSYASSSGDHVAR